MSIEGRGCVISSIARNLLLARKEVPLTTFRVTKKEARWGLIAVLFKTTSHPS
jgi:hypothetical protein